MTIFQILSTDHKTVLELLKKLEKTTQKQSTQREKLFYQFKREMLLHAKAEEASVYSRLKAKKETRELAFEATEEHALVDYLITQLDSLNKSHETWGVKLNLLKELVERHVEEEESEMFKKMKKFFNTSELAEMASEMLLLKTKAKRLSLAA